MLRMAVTLRDVAEAAGVSVRTVSNVVSDFPHVSDGVRRRVRQAIEDLDYRPNPIARTLRTGRTGMLALIVPEIDPPYFSGLARNVIDAAAEHGYRVMIDQTGHDHDRERELLTGGGRTMLFDGLLFSPIVTNAELLEMKVSRSVPLVLLGEYSFDGQYDHVAIDNVHAARQAVTHLINLGRTRIAAIGTQPLEQYSTPLQRASGYHEALRSAGFDRHPAYQISSTSYSRADGYAAAAQLLAVTPQPDAIFCFSDLLAIGAMAAIHDAGLRIPTDIAVIGIDDIEEGQYARPSLSSVSIDTPFIASEAVRLLAARIDDPESPTSQILAPHRVIPRQSTAVDTEPTGNN